MKKEKNAKLSLENFSNFILKHKIFVMVIVTLLFIASILFIIFYDNINSDVTSYLPDNTYTAKGYDFIRDNFGINGDLIISVTGASESNIASVVSKISKLGVSVTWIRSSMLSLMNLDEDTYLYLEKVLMVKGESEQTSIYALMISMEFSANDSRSFEVIDNCKSILEENNIEYALSGSTQLAKSIMDSSVSEIPSYIIVAVLLILAILLVSTNSYIEPLILFITLGIAIVLNLGTNFIFKDVSIITYSASSILQIGLSMDYAIFMIHRYRDMRNKGFDAVDSAKKTIPYTFSTIFASALTSVGGFIALYFMSYKIGGDLASVLIKGIILSFLTVLIVQPILLVLFDKTYEKTKHKYLNMHFRKTTGFVMKHKIIFTAFALILIIPSIILQSKLGFNYMKFEKPNENPTAVEIHANGFMNQILISVPISQAELYKQYDFIDSLENLNEIDFVLGLCKMLNERDAYAALNVDNSMLKSYVSNGYALYTVGTSIDYEGSEATELMNKIHIILNENFDNNYYITGTAQSIVEFAEITPRDFLIVSIVSLVTILIVLYFTLKSFRLSLLLCITIEFGIWINLGMSYIFAGEINFMSYIIISAVQMAATIDYAILLSSEYIKNKKNGQNPESAVFNATTGSAMSILLSASILSAACFSVFFMSKNLIVAEITMLIARGAIIAALLILFTLPSLLGVSSKIKYRIDAFLKHPDIVDNDDEINSIDEKNDSNK